MTTSVYLVCGLLLLGIVQISTAMDEETMKMIKALHDSCVAETGVDEQMITDCTNGVFAEDAKLKCYMKCLFVSISVLDEATGEWNLKVVEDLMPAEIKDVAKPILYDCGVVKGADNCDTSFQIHKCWQSKAPQIYQLY